MVTMLTRHTHMGVYGLIRTDKGVVLIRKGRGPYLGKWDLPGGRLEFGESPRDALTREILEETGLNVEAASLLDVLSIRFSHTLSDGTCEDLHHIGIVYDVIVSSMRDLRVCADGHDSLGSRILPMEEVRSLDLTPFAHKALDLEQLGCCRCRERGNAVQVTC